LNTPPNLGEGPGEETPDDRSADAGADRVQAAAELRRTSLAADPGRARRNTAFTVAGVAILLLCGFGLYSMKHGSASAPSSFQDKPKIDEDTSKSAPLDASRQRLPTSMASTASAPAASDASVDPEEARRQAMLRERAAAEAAARRQKEQALLEARRKSAIFGADGDGTGDAQGDEAGQQDADGHGLNHHSGEGPNDPNSAFARAAASEDDSAQKASRIDNLQCKILPGRILEGQLQPRVISDLPGSITVVLDRDAFGEKGRIALLPWGTRITGKPNSVVRKGQERSFIATAVAYRPDGVTIHIDSPVADQLGSAGLDGEVDNHVGQILGMSAALSLLGAGSSTYGVSSSDQNNSMAMYRAGVQQSMAQSSQQLLGGYVNIPPTIKNDQGTRVRIQVERVLDFSDYCKSDEGGGDQ
jgi:type IV secretion system protein VirB10